MIHERVDIERWKAEFPLNRLQEEARAKALEEWEKRPRWFRTQRALERLIAAGRPVPGNVTGPFDVALAEQLRDDLLPVVPKDQRVRTDVFIWSQSEAPRREVTKVGGLPYWPAERPWPVSVAGRPMTFVCQFCFADSRDIVGETPGDLLLIFTDSELFWEQGDAGIRFEWLALGEPSLVSEAAVPETEWQITPCHGAIHRTYDISGGERFIDHVEDAEALAVIDGTKIGGVPLWIQNDEEVRGKHLCSSASIQPALDRPYPFLNVREPLRVGAASAWEYLMWGDGGTLYVFLDGAQGIHWTEQCY
jgi:hypothetical protein